MTKGARCYGNPIVGSGWGCDPADDDEEYAYTIREQIRDELKLEAHMPQPSSFTLLPRRLDASVSMKIAEKFGPESLTQTQLDLRYLVY